MASLTKSRLILVLKKRSCWMQNHKQNQSELQLMSHRASELHWMRSPNGLSMCVKTMVLNNMVLHTIMYCTHYIGKHAWKQIGNIYLIIHSYIIFRFNKSVAKQWSHTNTHQRQQHESPFHLLEKKLFITNCY